MPIAGVAARLDRAFRNFMETFPFFAAVILAAHLAGREGAMTAWGAQLYFWARVVYLPLYAAGVPWLRSIVWAVSMLGLVLVLLAVLGAAAGKLGGAPMTKAAARVVFWGTLAMAATAMIGRLFGAEVA